MARGCTANRILSFPRKVGSHENKTNYILSDKLQNLVVEVTPTFPCQFSSRTFAFRYKAICLPIALRTFIRQRGWEGGGTQIERQ
jgi:hypothetical protein